MTYPDGWEFDGNFAGGVPAGEGKLKQADGATFTGAFKDGKRTGKGTLTYADGRTFTGTWTDVSGATNPLILVAPAGHKFYRLQP